MPNVHRQRLPDISQVHSWFNYLDNRDARIEELLSIEAQVCVHRKCVRKRRSNRRDSRLLLSFTGIERNFRQEVRSGNLEYHQKMDASFITSFL